MKEEPGLSAGIKLANIFLAATIIAVGIGFIFAFNDSTCRSNTSNIITYSILLFAGGLYLTILIKDDNSAKINLVVATFSLIFTLGLMELALQWFTAPAYERALFWSSTHFKGDDNGALTATLPLENSDKNDPFRL